MGAGSVPLVEELDGANLRGNILGEDLVGLRNFDLDFAFVVRHLALGVDV